jgi:hypothetical protein
MRMAFALVAIVLAPAAAPNVRALVLEPGQVGTGFVRLAAAGGNGVAGDRTMNLCGLDYPSERLRVGRIQMNFLKRGETNGITNEVVSYKAGGAAQAMREAIRHAESCPNRPIDSGQKGLPKLTFQVKRLEARHLLEGYLAVQIDVSGTVQGRHVAQTSFAVYQRRGNVLSGVYSFGVHTAGQLTLCLHAAQQSALNLRNGISSAPTA